MKRTIFAYPYIVWMVIFILFPVLLIGYYALFSDGTFTLSMIIGALTDGISMPVLLRSAIIALEATAVCILLGYPIAYMLSNMKKSTASLLSLLFIIPMWMNFLLRTYSWQVLLDTNGVLNSLFALLGLPAQQILYTKTAVMIGLVYNFLPFMILPIYTVLTKLDRSLIDAAHDLGANGPQTFLRVVLPQSMPGVISGITMVFIPALTTFAVSVLLGGGKVRMFGDLIEMEFITNGNWAGGSALSFILLILVLISMGIMRLADRDAGREGGKLW